MVQGDTDATSQAWIARLKEEPGAESKWEALSNRYDARLRVLAAHLMGPSLRRRADPEDVINEAWLRIIAQLDDFDYRGKNSLYYWLCQQVRRVVVDMSRRADFKRETNSLASQNQLADPHARDPHSEIARDELEIRMAETLETLPKTYRDVLVARLLEERSYAELSLETGARENTLAQQVLRGLELWRRALGHDPLSRI